MEEVKRLEQQLEIGINGQKHYTNEMESLDKETTTALTSVAAGAEEIAEDPFQPSLATATSIETDFDNAASHLQSTTGEELKESVAIATEAHFSEKEAVDQVGTNQTDVEAAQDEVLQPTVENFSFASNPTSVGFAEISTDALLEAENVQHETEQSERQSIASEPDVSIVTDSIESSQGESPMDVDSDSDGSASMSDSGSDDYEPAEPVVLKEGDRYQADEDVDDEYDPNDAPITVALPVTTEDIDDYEPAEVVDAMELLNPDTTTDSSDQGNISAPEAIFLEADQEHGLELSDANTLIKPQEMSPLAAGSARPDLIPPAPDSSTSRFRPYQSVLTNFKSYRFHPQFTEHVPEGYRSLTYSYNIDPLRPLCPTEAMGQMCTDIKCGEQHFRQMSLADENILIQLSSANDIPYGAQRDHFVAGLKVVVADLRSKNIHDFDQVASALVAYRRRFRQEQYPALAQTETTS